MVGISALSALVFANWLLLWRSVFHFIVTPSGVQEKRAIEHPHYTVTIHMHIYWTYPIIDGAEVEWTAKFHVVWPASCIEQNLSIASGPRDVSSSRRTFNVQETENAAYWTKSVSSFDANVVFS